MRKCVKLLIILITLSKNYDYIQHKSSNLSGQLSLSCDKTKLCFKFRMGDGILKKKCTGHSVRKIDTNPNVIDS